MTYTPGSVNESPNASGMAAWTSAKEMPEPMDPTHTAMCINHVQYVVSMQILSVTRKTAVNTNVPYKTNPSPD